MPLRKNAGSVMLEALVIGVIVAFLTASMAAMMLQRSYSATRFNDENQKTESNQGGLGLLIYSWNQSISAPGGVCQSLAGVYSCSPGNSCSCTCIPALSSNPTVMVSSTGGVWPQCEADIAVISP
ncbi:MAG: hypothetical protein ACYCPQ_01370 [Elusimicrobiota bacterium]